MILLDQSGRDQVRAQYAGRLEPIEAVTGLYFLPERLIAEFDGLDAYPTGDLLEGVKAHMLSRLAAIRWSKTQFFNYDGEILAYADAAIAVTTAKIRALEESESTDPVNFKLTATAWRSWSLADLKAYGAAIDAHIQACFDHEGTLSSQILAGVDLDALRAISLEVGWP